ncbi:chain-length determining protein [Chitiniphilus shinanonensis]|uniref:chain-length determining protein n=1 Tax=Chitiniphilus shinanonensis TaxID=553088 RepID=UPI0030657561
MIEKLKRQPLARLPLRVLAWVRHEMAPTLLRHRIIGAAVVVSLLSAVYWLAIASDRFVSEARVIIQRTDLVGGPSMDFSSLLAGMGNGSRADQLLLRDHLLSVDMLKKLDSALDLRAHYHDPARDPLSRMWSHDPGIERFHRHYLSRVSVEFDEYAGVLVIKAEGYDARMAHAITTLLVQEGELFMNRMAHGLAQAQVTFLEQQLSQMGARALRARQAVLAYQNEKGLVSPQATAENIAAIVASLTAQRAELEARRGALRAYLVPDHPDLVLLEQRIAAVTAQLTQEQAKLAAPGGKALNRLVEEFQRLEAEAGFAQDVYKTALVALEKGRIEATRTIKKMSVLQAPTLPEYPLVPRRFYNALVFLLVTMLLAGVAHLLAAIVRDHTD